MNEHSMRLSKDKSERVNIVNQIFSMLARHEREMHIERIKKGLAAKKLAAGKKL